MPHPNLDCELFYRKHQKLEIEITKDITYIVTSKQDPGAPPLSLGAAPLRVAWLV